jgi:hypothetical protein
MDDGAVKICQICGWAELDSLEDLQSHLNAHSKEDLVRLLLQKQTNSNTSSNYVKPLISSSKSTNSAGDVLHMTYSNPNYHETSQEDSETNLELNTPRSLTNLEPISLKDVENTDFTANNGNYEAGIDGVEDDLAAEYNLVPVATFTVPFPMNNEKEMESSYETTTACDLLTTINNDSKSLQCETFTEEESCQEEVVLGSSYLDNSITSCPSDESRSNQVVQEESDNATSQTSIIKYIIDRVCIYFYFIVVINWHLSFDAERKVK